MTSRAIAENGIDVDALYAQRDAALDCIASLLRLFDGKAYQSSQEQAAIAAAKALLREMGR